MSEGVTPGSSQITNVKMAWLERGCWEIESCSVAAGAAVNCDFGCKSLPTSCDDPCDCNGAWSTNKNGTITSVMDGKCLTLNYYTVNVQPCTGKANQKFTFKPVAAVAGKPTGLYTVVQGDLCVDNRAPPPPPPFPRSYPQLCGNYSVACQAVGVDQAMSISLGWSGIVEGVLVVDKKVYADAATCIAAGTPIIEFHHIGSFQDMGPQQNQADGSANARLVRINYNTIEVTPQSEDQVTSMQTNCPCNDATQWVLGTFL